MEVQMAISSLTMSGLFVAAIGSAAIGSQWLAAAG
jgi:hypothetical protein